MKKVENELSAYERACERFEGQEIAEILKRLEDVRVLTEQLVDKGSTASEKVETTS